MTSWTQADLAAIDSAYRAEYGAGSAVAAITSPTARATTLRVDPR